MRVTSRHESRDFFALVHEPDGPEKTVTADGWRHTSLQLQPLNPAFEPIEIEAEVAADIVIVGEFLTIAPKV